MAQEGSYSRIEDIKTELRLEGNEFTDAELQTYLERANRVLRGRVGNKLIEAHVVTWADANQSSTVFQLRYSPVLNFKEVEVWGEYQDSTDYTVDLETGLITFDSIDVSKANQVKFHYVPEIFADLEIVIAAELLLVSTKISKSNVEERMAQVESLREVRNTIIKDVNSSAGPRYVRDHTRNPTWHY